MTSSPVSGISVLQRGDGHDATADPAYDVACGLAERPRARGVGHLPRQVDQLLDPADEVAGGEVVLVQNLGEVVALGPAVRRPGESRVGPAEEVEPMLALDVRELAPEPLEVVDRPLDVTTGDAR